MCFYCADQPAVFPVVAWLSLVDLTELLLDWHLQAVASRMPRGASGLLGRTEEHGVQPGKTSVMVTSAIGQFIWFNSAFSQRGGKQMKNTLFVG